MELRLRPVFVLKRCQTCQPKMTFCLRPFHDGFSLPLKNNTMEVRTLCAQCEESRTSDRIKAALGIAKKKKGTKTLGL